MFSGDDSRADQRRQAIAKARTSRARAPPWSIAPPRRSRSPKASGSRKEAQEQARRSADPHRAGGLVDAQKHTFLMIFAVIARRARRADLLQDRQTPLRSAASSRHAGGSALPQFGADAHANAAHQAVHRRPADRARHHRARRARRPAARRHAADHRQRGAGAGASPNSARWSNRRRSAFPSRRPP